MEQPINHPIALTLVQLEADITERLQDESREPTNRDVLWSTFALVKAMNTHFAYSTATRQIVEKLQARCDTKRQAEQSSFWGRLWNKLIELFITALAGLALLAGYWLFLQVAKSGVSLPTP